MEVSVGDPQSSPLQYESSMSSMTSTGSIWIQAIGTWRYGNINGENCDEPFENTPSKKKHTIRFWCLCAQCQLGRNRETLRPNWDLDRTIPSFSFLSSWFFWSDWVLNHFQHPPDWFSTGSTHIWDLGPLKKMQNSLEIDDAFSLDWFEPSD